MFIKEKCLEYAFKWAYNYNTKYYDFSNLGGDCTNFISQCMFNGGFEMDYSLYGWYYDTLNNRAPAWTGVNEFWNYAINNDKRVGVKLKEITLQEVELCDVIQLFNGERYYHNLLVTNLDNGIIKVTGHDNNVKNMPLRYYNYKSLRVGKVVL